MNDDPGNGDHWDHHDYIVNIEDPSIILHFPLAWGKPHEDQNYFVTVSCLHLDGSLKRSELKELEKPYHIEMKILHSFHATPVNIYNMGYMGVAKTRVWTFAIHCCGVQAGSKM